MVLGSRPTITFKAIVPKKGFLYNLFERAIRTQMERYARPELRELFYRTVSTWSTKVYFRGTISSVPGRYIRLLVKPYGSGEELYNLLARGADPHPISARNAPYLVFRRGFVSATRPRWIGSRRAQYFGPWQYRTFIPEHPGFEGRFWDEEIAEKYENRFIYLMERAVRDYARQQANAFRATQKTEEPRPVERT